MVERGDEVTHIELSADETARLEANARRVLCWRGDGSASRGRSIITITYDGDRGLVVTVTPREIRICHPTIKWKGPHTPVRSVRTWRKLRANAVSDAELVELLGAGIEARRRQFKKCRLCTGEFPPEHRHGSVCHGCAEAHLGVLH